MQYLRYNINLAGNAMLHMKKSFDNESSQETTTDQHNEPISNSPAEGAKKKPRSEKQREASRRNGSRGHGPNDTTRTRYNAMRHGLRAQGLTPWDDADEYREILRALEDRYSSSDPFVAISISESALEMIRIRRINRLEADNIVGMSSFSGSSSDSTSDGTPTIHFAALNEYGSSLDLLDHYKAGSMNRLLRWRRELERVPRDEASEQSTDTGTDDDEGVV
jgi:hypothetical protein